ncbi:hypothetical protein [Pendulispora albinea]|uniref:PH domain-containing protein n=1 Tax=Pendulispora albinea TaxID=2741071 RepID=A0ABZ2M8B2_9BACT
MERDSLFNETILWSGRPRVVRAPLGAKLVAAVCATVSLVTLSFAVLARTSLHAHVGGMILFALWCASIALGAWRLPILWRSGVEYIVTEKHIIWRRGRVRRTMDRSAISYAVIRWDPKESDVGDLILVRAVPTGALRRTLKLALHGVTGPDRLWAIVRGMTPCAPLGQGTRPLGQRLDPGERVLWSGIPLASSWTSRRLGTAVLSLVVSLAAVHVLVRAIPTLRGVLRLHALPPVMLGLLIFGVALTVLLLAAVAIGVGYASVVRPMFLARRTIYVVTNRRVLIRRHREELHLERGRIAYVIAAPARRLHDVFLVLDGPQARALAPSGAFASFGREEAEGALLPVFARIEDAETVGVLLQANASGDLSSMRDAA